MPEAAYLAVLPKAPANYDPVRETQRALDRRNYVLREMYRNGYISENDWKRPPPLRSTPSATAPASIFATWAAISWRRSAASFSAASARAPKTGPTASMRAGCGCALRSIPRCRSAMALALQEGLANFDGGRGWRDLKKSIAVDGDWAGRLDRTPVGTGFPDWVKAVVLSRDSNSATIGFANGKTYELPALGGVDAQARRRRLRLRQLQAGMIIVVKDDGDGSYALRSIPLVSAECSRRRSTPAGSWRCRAASTSSILLQPGNPGARQPGSAFKPIVYVTGLENGFTPATIDLDAPFCVWQGAGLGNKCFTNFDGRYAARNHALGP